MIRKEVREADGRKEGGEGEERKEKEGEERKKKRGKEEERMKKNQDIFRSF